MSYSDVELGDLDAYLDAYLKGNRKPKFPFSLFYTVGIRALKLRHYERALDNFNNALKKDPSNVPALLKRCKAYLGLQQYAKAREDAAEALRNWPEFSEAFDLMGQSEFLMGDFEGGYLTYMRGRQVRPISERLRLGQQVCQAAMHNSMHRSGLTVGKPDIELLRRARTGKQRLSRTVPCEYFNYERFAKDREVFEDLMADRNLKSVHGICKEALNTIDNNQRFGAMQVPIYSRKKAPQPRRQAARRSSVFHYVTSVMKRCDSYLKRGSERMCIVECQKLIGTIESRPELSLHQKMKLEADVLHLLSVAHEKENRESLSMDDVEEELKIAKAFSLMLVEVRALHRLGEYYLRKDFLDGACYCYRTILEALTSKRLQALEADSETLKDDLTEIQAAEAWTRKFRWKLKSSIRNSIINPVIEMFHRTSAMHEDTWSSEANTSAVSIPATDVTGSYYTAKGMSDSELSFRSIDSYHQA